MRSSPATTSAPRRGQVIELVGLPRRPARASRLSQAARSDGSTRRRPRRRPELLFLDEPDGLRPGGAAQRLGDDPLAEGSREDDCPDDALPRRGPAARRPRRRPPRRPDRASRHAGRAHRGHSVGRDPLPARRRGGRARDGRADAGAARADRRGGRLRDRARGAEVRRPSLEDVYLELVREDAE